MKIQSQFYSGISFIQNQGSKAISTALQNKVAVVALAVLTYLIYRIASQPKANQQSKGIPTPKAEQPTKAEKSDTDTPEDRQLECKQPTQAKQSAITASKNVENPQIKDTPSEVTDPKNAENPVKATLSVEGKPENDIDQKAEDAQSEAILSIVKTTLSIEGKRENDIDQKVEDAQPEAIYSEEVELKEAKKSEEAIHLDDTQSEPIHSEEVEIEEDIDPDEAKNRKEMIERKINELEDIVKEFLEDMIDEEVETKEENIKPKFTINWEDEREKLIKKLGLEGVELTPTNIDDINNTLSVLKRENEKARFNALLEEELKPKLPKMNKNIINRTFAELINENKEIIKIIHNFSKNCIEIPENFPEDDLIKALKIFKAETDKIEYKLEDNTDTHLINNLINYLQYCKFKNTQPEIESNDISRLIKFMTKQKCIYRNSRKLLREHIKYHKKLILKMMESVEKKTYSGNYDEKIYIFSIDPVVAKHGVACYEWSHQMARLRNLERIFSSRIKKISASNIYLKELGKNHNCTIS